MSEEPNNDVTRLLQEFDEHEDAAEALLPLVYEQLRAIAQRRMSSERSDHTLQATALVHEAYVRLVGGREVPWKNRGHFFAIAADAMRRILIDHARRKGSQKRGGGKPVQPLNVVDLAVDHDAAQIIALDDALSELEKEDERAAAVVKLRFFAGLNVEETAEAMGISARTVMREWSYARARLFQLLNAPEP